MNLKKVYQLPFCSKRGLSLVEVMIVLVILASIAAAMGMMVQGQFAKSRIQNTKIIISSFSKAIDIFNIDCGFYPHSLDDLQRAPEACGSDWGPEAYLKPRYFPPKDAWKQPLIYELNDGNYVLKSLGKDGREGGTGENADLSSETI